MSKFGERVRDAMFAVGLQTTAQLAKACGASRQTVAAWLELHEPHLSAMSLLALADALHVRMRWLATGNGVSGWRLLAGEPDLERAVTILERLSPKLAREWLKIGERMVAGA